MDIRHWLENTEIISPPQPLHDSRTTKTHKDFCEVRRSRNDSSYHPSLGDSGLRLGLRTPEIGKTRSRKRRHQSPSHSTHASTSSPSSVSPSSPSLASETFERRPRHKTRDDLYKPDSGTRKRRSRKKNKESRKNRKDCESHHRTRKSIAPLGRPGKGMMEKFHAENVPQERLTVRSQLPNYAAVVTDTLFDQS